MQFQILEIAKRRKTLIKNLLTLGSREEDI